jgi:hypothetical protein
MNRIVVARALALGCACAALAAACGGSSFNGTIGDDGGPPVDGGGNDARVDTGTGEGGGQEGGADAPADSTGGDAPPSCPTLCIPPPPAGWQGPLELYHGAGPAPSCAGAYAGAPVFDGHAGLDAPPATCGCTCGDPAGGTCSGAAALFYSGSCNGAPCAKASIPNGGCTTIDPGNQCGGAATISVSIDAPFPLGSTCQPASSQMVPPVSWSADARACAPASPPPQGSCGQGQVCPPSPDQGFVAGYCAAHDGDVPCPGAPYMARMVAYTGVDDTRACTKCGCDAPVGETCAGVARSYGSSNGTCAVQTQQDTLPLACGTATNVKTDWSVDAAPSGGSCGTTGGQPSGAATPTGAVTFCCSL